MTARRSVRPFTEPRTVMSPPQFLVGVLLAHLPQVMWHVVDLAPPHDPREREHEVEHRLADLGVDVAVLVEFVEGQFVEAAGTPSAFPSSTGSSGGSSSARNDTGRVNSRSPGSVSMLARRRASHTNPVHASYSSGLSVP